MPLTIRSANGIHRFTVQIAATLEQQEHGLMFVRSLGGDQGMIFPYDPPQDVSFWMKNTLIPLDIMFITADFSVAGILENMQPLDTNSKGVGKPSLYVLEVNGGYAKAHGISAGTKVRFEGVEAAAQ